MNIESVNSGDTLNIGNYSLKFFHTPMVHWPDSMVTFLTEENLLFSNDSFGQHYCTDSIFSDENLKDILFFETAKYYSNIVYPYGKQVLKALDLLKTIEINTIAPSHGVVWRNSLENILAKYRKWASHESENKALIVYDTMWKSTEIMAQTIKSALISKNIPVTMKCLSYSHYSEILPYLLDSKYIFIGTATLNNEVLPSMAAFLTYIKGLKPKNKVGFIFGSYGWAKKALSNVSDILKTLKWDLPKEPYYQKFVPKPEDLKNLNQTVLSIFG